MLLPSLIFENLEEQCKLQWLVLFQGATLTLRSLCFRLQSGQSRCTYSKLPRLTLFHLSPRLDSDIYIFDRVRKVARFTITPSCLFLCKRQPGKGGLP